MPWMLSSTCTCGGGSRDRWSQCRWKAACLEVGSELKIVPWMLSSTRMREQAAAQGQLEFSAGGKQPASRSISGAALLDLWAAPRVLWNTWDLNNPERSKAAARSRKSTKARPARAL